MPSKLAKAKKEATTKSSTTTVATNAGDNNSNSGKSSSLVEKKTKKLRGDGGKKKEKKSRTADGDADDIEGHIRAIEQRAGALEARVEALCAQLSATLRARSRLLAEGNGDDDVGKALDALGWRISRYIEETFSDLAQPSQRSARPDPEHYRNFSLGTILSPL